ncbi:serine/threonine transporter [Zophobihabitans entericus]|uniref:HAAAP family serine/threonine permease n=1 Tax=Zophobihabitans entericus TaxID=1635327 RepID=A0A6G9IAH4_9GAMM|nr:serine/threonine transporter [Zophobihabitans entericus]QIQ20832.1 HAAAP family serine/threonine permease [Zophobihabitans entericus]
MNTTTSIKTALKNDTSTTDLKKWCYSDTLWMLSLYGTAIGAGVLFLPINAGAGGLIPLIVMAILAFPMTFYAHRALARFVLAGKDPNGDITVVATEFFGISIGRLITLLYFFAIYPILLVYSVGITNTVESFIVHQMGMTAPPRMFLSFILIALLMTIVHFGEGLIVRVMSVLVFPFVGVLMLLALYLIPQWNGALFENISFSVSDFSLWHTLWLAIPVMVFSFNHSPIISSLAVAKRKEYGDKLVDKKCSQIIAASNIMMVITVMFFVFSCALTLSPAQLAEAKAQNISILSYLANALNSPVIAYLAPFIAFVAISKSFLGHYLGAKEGFNSLVAEAYTKRNKHIDSKKLDRITMAFMFITAWIIATLNPSILGMIEALGGPVIAMILFIMPMYAIHKVPALKQYRGKISNIFVVIMGLIAISAVIYNLVS